MCFRRCFSTQNDLLATELVHKIEDKKDSQFDYEGRIADRETEADYTTENLQQVGSFTL